MATKTAAPTNDERRLEYLSLDALAPALRNPKRHSADIDASMTRFGFTEPVILDERTGRLVAGHGRVEALRKLRTGGSAAPEGVRAQAGQAGGPSEGGDEWFVPVLRGWSSRSDAEAEAYLVASNRLVEAGGWDEEALAKMVEGMGSLEGVGFSEADLDVLLSRASGVGVATDAFEEWEGMPSFENKTLCFRKLVVNFADQATVDAFAKLIGQEITERARSIWHPYQPQRDLESMRYEESDGVSAEEADEAADL